MGVTTHTFFQTLKTITMFFNKHEVELLNSITQRNNDNPYGLGRLVAQDQRDYPMAALLSQVPVTTRRYRYWNDSDWWGDQGQTNECVGFSCAHYVEDGPITYPTGPSPILSPHDIYNWANANDEWSPEPHEGSSVRAGFKFLKLKGFVESYYMTQNIEECKHAIMEVGPVVFGTPWKTSMFYPTSAGLLKLDHEYSGVAGGHAYEVNGYSRDTGLFRIKQSWVRTWGLGGHAYIKEADLAFLLSYAGEAAIAKEIKNKNV